MRIIGLCGSLRGGSYNRKLLDTVGSALPNGAELELYEGIGELPPYSEEIDVEPAPPAVRRLREAIEHADALLIATPEYNSSIPGALKNAIDWASRPFPDNSLRDKPAAVVGASRSPFGAAWAQAELRKVLKTCGADVIDREVPVGRVHEQFDAAGDLRDALLRGQLAGVAGELVRRATGSDGGPGDELSRAA
ncbi:MAG TPA: NADPH-dependent FMN reductase [Thermoleophilaceae bacterium]|jgi:chromate reductase